MTIACPLCGREAVEFVRREGVPAHQHLLYGTAAAARAVPRGTLSYRACPACGFVYNAAFDPALLDYGGDYNNSQNHSPAFREHVDGLVDLLLNRKGVRNARVVEVGCGDGAFLRRLVEPEGAGNVGFGFDPSYTGPADDLGGRLKFFRAVYDESSPPLAADAVVSRHVIEHIPAPLAMLAAIRGALGGRAARVFFETPCVDWILRGHVVWDLFYEHCSLFTLGSLGYAFQAAGFEVAAAGHVFGGQYLWVEATPAAGKTVPRNPGAAETVRLAHVFAAEERVELARWGSLLAGLEGRVAVWGAGAKAVTFCQLLDPEGDRIDCLADVNPAKQGRFLVGTGHPILPPAALAGRGVRHVLVLNPNYADEIRAAATALGLPAAVHDLTPEPARSRPADARGKGMPPAEPPKDPAAIAAIAAMAADPAVRAAAKALFEATIAHRYSYNFTWLGRPVIQYPQDMLALQEIIWEVKPRVIVETGIAHGGSLVFSASMLELIGGDGAVVGVDIDIRAANRAAVERHPLARRITMIEGSSIAAEVVAEVTRLAAGPGPVLVCLDSNHTHDHVLEELRAYAPLVSVGSYLIVMDTVVEDLPPELIVDRPWAKGNNPKTAVHEFLRTTDGFEIDEEYNRKLLLSVAPDGYLRRVR